MARPSPAVASEPASATPGVFSADSLMSHVRDTGQQTGTWVSTPEFEELEPGEVGGFTVAGIAMLVCRNSFTHRRQASRSECRRHA